MITFVKDDIACVEADVIVNAANGIGFMGGFIGRFFKLKGVAESLHYHSKGKIERLAKKEVKKKKPKKGEVYVTPAESLKAKWIFHAVTMKRPGTWSYIETVETCLQNIIMEAKRLDVKTIAIPGLGTGTGGLKLSEVIPLYKKYLEVETDLTFILVDPSGNMQMEYEK